MSRAGRVTSWVLGTLFGMSFFICMGLGFVVEVPVLLVVGWGAFLLRVVPEVTPRWGAIAETVAVAAVLAVGTHLFLRRLWQQLHGASARPWPVRWSMSLVALVVLLFSATMATVGLGHHVGWLAASRESLVESNWRFMRMAQEGKGLCRRAVHLAAEGLSEALISQRLLAEPETRPEAEQMYVVPLSQGSAPAFVVFPRDPVTREWAGGVRCAGGQDETRVEANELPRLMSERRVATDAVP